MDEKQPEATTPRRLNPAMVKVCLIALIFGLLQVPLYLIEGTIAERQNYNVEYSRTYAGWGAGEQTIIGPVLSIPYRVSDKETSLLNLFPNSLDVSGSLVPEIREGGKFKNILYSAALDLKGNFDTSEIAQKKIDEANIRWEDAFVTLGISDLRGIRRETVLNWGDTKTAFTPGTNGFALYSSGQTALLKGGVKADRIYNFSMKLMLNGSRELNIFPAAKETKIALSSTWQDPNWTGGFLPVRRHADKNGFNAEWEVSYFNRSIPQIWSSHDSDLSNSLSQYMTGVSLATPTEFYQTATRAVKYGCLFIIFPFLTFFIFEVITKIRIHEMQYLLVGLSLSLFFLMLIAISEYIPFVWAYVIASGATIIQITAYTRSFSLSRSSHLWKIMAGALTGLYIYLYVLLRAEDMSLLFGAIGLFLGLTLVLYATRHINWHTMQPETAG
jgi:inner membrane protein